MKKVLIWDLPVRLMHGLLAACVIGAFALASLASDDSAAFALHAVAGLLAVVVVVLRIVWGLVGTKHARFGSFSLRPAALARHLKAALSFRPPGDSGPGHNAATSWFAMAVFAGLLGLGLTGVLAARGSEGAEEIHEILAWSVIGLVVVHVAGVVLHSVLTRDNLAASMITGRKAGAESDGIPSVRAGVAALLLGVVAVTGAVLLSGFDARARRLTLPGIGTTLALGEHEGERGGAAHDAGTGDAQGHEAHEDGRDDEDDDD